MFNKLMMIFLGIFKQRKQVCHEAEQGILDIDEERRDKIMPVRSLMSDEEMQELQFQNLQNRINKLLYPRACERLR